MSLINVNNLTFAYDGSYDNIFERVSFQLDTDWKLGFIGRNGRGKTTFLRLLTGQYKYTGTISAKVKFSYFPFSVEDENQLTLDIVDQLLPCYAYWQLSRELNYLETSDEVLYRPFNTLSKGEQTKVLLAALFLRENSFLLIDEPTNHLDSHARQVVSNYLKKKKGFILVSHDRAFLDNCIDHVLVINRSDIQVQKGNFSTWQHNKMLQDNFEAAEQEKLIREIKSMEAAARRSARWSDTIEKRKVRGTGGDSGVKPDKGHIGRQAAKMMKRAKSAENRKQKAIDEKAGLLKNVERTDMLKLHPLQFHTDPLLTLDDISICYPSSPPVCSGLHITLNRGDRIALTGSNGCGKSSILKLILGQHVPHTGTIRIPAGLRISYVPQDTGQLSGSLNHFAVERNIDETLLKTILHKLDFERVQFEKPMEDYSGGQKKKVLIAASLCEEAHLYIWDEPLNFIDVLSRIQIEQLLLTYTPTILFVEHDQTFCEHIATHKIDLTNPK